MGAPKGNKNGARGREWRDSLIYALENYKGTKKGMALRAIGEKLVEMALEGDMQAIKEIGDRIDGKAVQVIDAKIEEVTSVEQLTDEQLINIAAASSARAVKSKGSKKKPDQLH